MASVFTKPPTPAGQQRVPMLANGDHLKRDEFHRRYAAMPGKVWAELIEGTVYIAPTVRHHEHAGPHAILGGWLGHYVAKTPGFPLPGNRSTTRLDENNELQPDLLLMLPSHMGGRATIDSDGYISGAPALVCEIAASSVSIDLHTKKSVYCRHGVQEYLVWRTEDAAIEWFSLESGEFVSILPREDGMLYSKIFPGLCLHPSSLLGADLPALFTLLDKTTATPEHADFAAKLHRTTPASPQL
jgi:Uma2 family endonuclease